MTPTLSTTVRLHLSTSLLILLFVTTTNAGMPPDWEAGMVIENSELIAVVGGPLSGRFVSSAEVFSSGAPARIQRYAIVQVLMGDVDEGADIVIAQPSGHMHGYASIFPGESMLFLKRMAHAEVQLLRENAPPWADELPDEVWTFAWDKMQLPGPEGPVPGPDGYQWMSWIQLKTIRPDGEIDEQPRSILVAQLTRFAGVEKEREAILTYVQELVTLRQAALAGAELPDEENLDRFQKAVVQGAVKELQESQD